MYIKIENHLEKVQLIYPNGIRPTRKNVVDNRFLNLISGGVNMFATHPIAVNVDTINRHIGKYAAMTSIETEADFLIRILRLVKSETSEDFDTDKFIACLQGLKAQRPHVNCRLIVRIDRDIAKGTGTLLSPNDRALGDKYQNEVVLTMYRIKGSKDKGWEGTPLWIPNIKFPDDCCFYDVEEEM